MIENKTASAELVLQLITILLRDDPELRDEVLTILTNYIESQN